MDDAVMRHSQVGKACMSARSASVSSGVSSVWQGGWEVGKEYTFSSTAHHAALIRSSPLSIRMSKKVHDACHHAYPLPCCAYRQGH